MVCSLCIFVFMSHTPRGRTQAPTHKELCQGKCGQPCHSGTCGYNSAPLGTDTRTLSNCRNPNQPKSVRGDRSPTPPPHPAAGQVGPSGCWIATVPLRPIAPDPQPGLMASILPAVAAGEAAAARNTAPVRMTAQPPPPSEAVWGASPIPAAQPVALFSSGIFLG